jgi:hypothetical protein
MLLPVEYRLQPRHPWNSSEGRQEWHALYRSVLQKQAAHHREKSRTTTPGRFEGPTWLFQPYLKLVGEIAMREPLFAESKPPRMRNLEEALVEWNLLQLQSYATDNLDMLSSLLGEAMRKVVSGWTDALANVEVPDGYLYKVPLISLIPDPGAAIQRIIGIIQDHRYTSEGIFVGSMHPDHFKNSVGYHLRHNVEASLTYTPERGKDYIDPKDSALAPVQMAELYLKNTPFLDFFLTPVPFPFSRDDRMNHMHIIGGTGAGKTTLLENLFYFDALYDLGRDTEPCSIVLIEPHGDLIKRLARRDIYDRDRVILIDPSDIRHPPAINVFALNRERLAKYDDVTREQVVAGVIDTFDYLFSGLFGAELTAKQGVFFRYMARLMLTLPEVMGRNATILDMMRLMVDDTPYRPAIARLPDLQREFFEHDFRSQSFRQTKEQIRYRLQAIVENPTLARLFTSLETKLDLFEEMNRGSIILIDTANYLLKSGSPIFGRVMIALVMQAIMERAAIAPQKRRDTFLIIDEAATYFDENIDDMLTEARKYRCGLVLAHQHLGQPSQALRASLAANTGIKFVSSVSTADARAMAPEMRTTPEFIVNLPRHTFAGYTRGKTRTAVPVPIRILEEIDLDHSPAMYEDFLARNRARVSLATEEEHRYPMAAEPEARFDHTPQEPDEEKWS